MLIRSCKTLSGIQRLSMKYRMRQNRKNNCRWPNEKKIPAFHRVLQTMAYLQTTASTGIIFKISAVSLAQASTNIPALQCLGKPQTLGRWPMATELCRAHGVRELQRQNLSQQMGSPLVPGHAFYKNHHFHCTAVPWSNGGDLPVLRLVTTHWTKHSRWHTARCWTEELHSNFTVFLRRSISWYLSDSVWVYLMLPNFLLQSCLSPLSLASVLMRLS